MRRSRQLWLSVLIALPLAVYAACGDDDAQTAPPGSTSSGGTDASADRKTTPTGDDDATADADTTGDDDDTDSSTPGVMRGPVSLDFDKDGNGDPTSLVWDDAEQVLYVADNKNNDIWRWTDKDRTFTKHLKIPNSNATGPFPTDVGQLVKLPDGTFVVPRFGGSGGNSAVAFVKDATTKGEVPGVDATLKRVALTGDGSQTMYGATFIKATGDDAGVVTRVTTSKEEPYAAGFQKVVSTVVKGKALYVVDQSRDTVYILPTDGGAVAPYDVFATVPFPDTMVEGPKDTFLTGQFKASTDGGKLEVRKISADGKTVTSFDTGGLPLSKPKGLAYDKTNKRLFVADSNGTAVRTIKIFPLE
ncbi:MAG: hypothetical protein U0270_40720 [Labilithrix sp.]